MPLQNPRSRPLCGIVPRALCVEPRLYGKNPAKIRPFPSHFSDLHKSALCNSSDAKQPLTPNTLSEGRAPSSPTFNWSHRRALSMAIPNRKSQMQNREIHPKPNRFPTKLWEAALRFLRLLFAVRGSLRGIFGCGATRLREYGLQRPMTETATMP
jgi:hypothetical protein